MLGIPVTADLMRLLGKQITHASPQPRECPTAADASGTAVPVTIRTMARSPGRARLPVWAVVVTAVPSFCFLGTEKTPAV